MGCFVCDNRFLAGRRGRRPLPVDGLHSQIRCFSDRPYEAHRIFEGRGVHCTSAKICSAIKRTTDGRRQDTTRLQAISSPLQWILLYSVWGIYKSPVFVVFIYYCKLTELSAVKLEIPYPASLRTISTMRTAFFSPTVASAVSVSVLVCPPPNKL